MNTNLILAIPAIAEVAATLVRVGAVQLDETTTFASASTQYTGSTT